jgi:hypothetical protein
MGCQFSFLNFTFLLKINIYQYVISPGVLGGADGRWNSTDA